MSILSKVALAYQTWNRLFFTQISLGSLLATDRFRELGHFRVYDNMSEDGTYEYLRSQAITVERGSFPSAVSGLNKLFEEVKENPQIEWLMKFDNDVQFLWPAWLSQLEEALISRPDIGTIWFKQGNSHFFPKIDSRLYTKLEEWPYDCGGLRIFRKQLYKPNYSTGFIEFEALVREIRRKGYFCGALGIGIKTLDRDYPELTRYYVKQGWTRPKDRLMNFGSEDGKSYYRLNEGV